LKGVNEMSVRFGYVTVSSPLTPEQKPSARVADYAHALEALGGKAWEYGDTADPAPMLIFVATGGTERTILEMWRRRAETAARFPALMVAHSADNSLPAALEALARLRQDGQKGRILYLDAPGDAAGLARVSESAKDVDVQGALKRARIGLVGSPSGWLVASSPDPSVVRKVWGPQVVPVSLDQLTETIRGASGPDVKARRSKLVDGAAEIKEPGQGEIEVAMRVSTAVRQIADRHGMAGIALRCFDLIEQLGTTGCVALSELSDDGLAGGCEGDVVSTVGALWVRLLLDEPSWVANPSRIDTEANSLVLAHCTVPRSMVDSYRLRSHFESGSGVAIQGTFAPGPVTLFRIGGREMEELWMSEGEIVSALDADDLCRTQVRVRLAGSATVGDMLTRPLGNHIILVRGNHASRLRSWWELLIRD
jgi:L-fucose isomerase-like protein